MRKIHLQTQPFIQHVLSFLIYGLSTAIGLLAFLYPFWQPSTRPAAMGMAHTHDAPVVLTLLVGICFVALLLEVQGQAVSAKFIALLGVLVSMNALLRFIEVVIPGPGGFSPILVLVVLTGYVYGGRFGFLLGAMTLLVSALITGGAGPWLPYQMYTAGWVGLSAPLCRLPAWLLRCEGGKGGRQREWVEVALLALFGGAWGLIYGAIMNIWFWPFATGPADQYWQAGTGVAETLRRYAAFYLVTSLLWDLARAVGTTALILAVGRPMLRALRRFRQRFAYSYQPAPPAQ